MAEKIKLFELNIDIDAAIKSTAAMRDNADQLKIKYDALRKSSSASTEEVIRARGEYDNANKQYRQAQNEVTKLTSLKGKEIKTVEEGRTALSLLNAQWAKQASLYGENSAQAEKLAKQTKETRERLKELESGVGDNTRNVGNYTASFKDAISQSGLFGQAQGVVNNVTSAGGPLMLFLSTGIKKVKTDYQAAQVNTAGFTKAQIAAHVASTSLSAGLKILRLALIATGIGAIVVLLGSFVAFLTKSQAGIDLVNKALAGLTAGFDVIIDRFIKAGAALVKIFSGDIRGGLKDLTSSFEGMGDEIQREINLAVELENVLQGVAKAEVNLDIRRKAANARLKELNKTVEDQTKTQQERIAAAEEFARIDNALTAEEVSNQEKKVAAILGFSEVTDEVRAQIEQIGRDGVSLDQLGLSESTLEDAKEFRDEIGKLYDLQAKSSELQVTNQNKLNSIRKEQKAKEEAAFKEAQARAKAATDAAIKESQTRLNIFLEENKGKADSLAAAVKIEEEARDRRLKILEDEVAAGNKTQSEAELERLKIKNEFLDQQRAAVETFAAQEFEAFKSQHQARIDAGQLLNDELVAQETARLEAIAEKEKEYQAKRLEAGIINQAEYNSAIQAINDEAQVAQDAVKAERDAQQKEKEAIDFENRMAVESENFLASLEVEKQRLEMQRLAEVEKAEKTGADVALINQKYAQQQEQIEAEKQAFKQEAASQTFGHLADLLGKETMAGKAAALVQIAIDTQRAAMAAYAAVAGINPILGVIAAASAIAAGVKAAGKVTGLSEPKIPKAAKGITLEGRSHAGGGETLYNSSGQPLVEAEAGENVYVLNKKASGLINTLSNINQLTGGVALSKSTRYAAAGGMVKRSVTGSGSGINYDQLTESLAAAYAAAPAPRVALDEFNKASGKYAEVKEGAIF